MGLLKRKEVSTTPTREIVVEDDPRERVPEADAARDRAAAELERVRVENEEADGEDVRALSRGEIDVDEYGHRRAVRDEAERQAEDALDLAERVAEATRKDAANRNEREKAEHVFALEADDAADGAREEELETELAQVRTRRSERETQSALARHELSRARRAYEPVVNPERAYHEMKGEREQIRWFAENLFAIDRAPLHLHAAIHAEAERLRREAEAYNARNLEEAKRSWAEMGVKYPFAS